jgi:predicted naringenin-chalcone synthase
MTKAEVEIELIHAIHHLSFEEMQEMLENVLSTTKKDKVKPIEKSDSFADRDLKNDIFQLDTTFKTAKLSERNMIDELIANPLKIADPKPLSRDEIYASRKN